MTPHAANREKLERDSKKVVPDSLAVTACCIWPFTLAAGVVDKSRKIPPTIPPGTTADTLYVLVTVAQGISTVTALGLSALDGAS